MKIATGIIFFAMFFQLCNAQEYRGDYWDFYFYHSPSTSSEATGKIYLNSNNDAFSSLYNPALPSCSDNLRSSYSNSQNAFIYNDLSFNEMFHNSSFYNAFGIDVPIKNVGTFSFVRNYNHIILFSEVYSGNIETNDISYNFNYSREIFKGFHAGVGINYLKWDAVLSPNYSYPDRFFEEYYSLNLGVSYNYTLPNLENYSHSAFINLSVINLLTSHPNTKNDFRTKPVLPQIDLVSLGYTSKYKGFGLLKGIDDFQTNIQFQSSDLLNSYYYCSYSVGAEIKFIEIISLKVGNYILDVDYTTYGLGLSLPLKLISEIPLVIGMDYSHLKAPVFYEEGNKGFDSFTVNLRYDIL
jgi:hypothetical protein